jgi:divalent metal cation (Fe/Co/Zn/Cd) transporter
MCAASVVVIYKAIDTIINNVQFFTEPKTRRTLAFIDMSVFPFSVMVITAVIKSILFFFCYRIKTPTLYALATDHRNDVASNIVALICGLIGIIYRNQLYAYMKCILFLRFTCLSTADKSKSNFYRSYWCYSHFNLYYYRVG